MRVHLLFIFLFVLFTFRPVLLSFPTRRSSDLPVVARVRRGVFVAAAVWVGRSLLFTGRIRRPVFATCRRSEEHTSELQSRGHLVCRLLLEKKNLQEASAVTDVLKELMACVLCV